MKITNRLCLTLLTWLAIGSCAHAQTPPTRTISITAGDNLRFSVTKIEAQPGERLQVQLHNAGTLPKNVMGHNWILLQAGQNPDAYAAAAMVAAADNYEPKKLMTEVLTGIPLLGPGETQTVTFTAPSAPGTYPYLCSFPAHCAAGMRGTLVVR